MQHDKLWGKAGSDLSPTMMTTSGHPPSDKMAKAKKLNSLLMNIEIYMHAKNTIITINLTPLSYRVSITTTLVRGFFTKEERK